LFALLTFGAVAIFRQRRFYHRRPLSDLFGFGAKSLSVESVPFAVDTRHNLRPTGLTASLLLSMIAPQPQKNTTIQDR
jgi:hypothetical protein